MYFRPDTIAEAVSALSRGAARVLAGGTDFYPALGDRAIDVPVIDISAIAELMGIQVSADAIRIGGRVTWSQIIAADLPACCRALQEAAREVGSVQIQNVATIAGNICNASPAADSVPPLLALDAEVEMADSTGVRRLPLAQFLQGNRKTVLRPNELVTAITIPIRRECRSAFLKLGLRRYLVISIAMVAALIERDERGLVAHAAISVGGCSVVARRLLALEQALMGAPAVTGLGRRALDGHFEILTPIDDIRASADYRRLAARVLVQRAIESCVAER
jgi:CO/xanthine dehydrogenase FAD-binding subunit